MRISLLSGAAIAALVAAPAMAADLAPYPTKAAPPPFVESYSWAGFYIGVNAGYGFGRNNATLTGQAPINVATVVDGARPSTIRLSPEGFIGGAQMGYNWHMGGSFVAGLEADIQYTDFRDTVNVVTTGVAFPGVRNNTFQQRLEYLGTFRGRLGMGFDRTLLYVTGGLAYGGVNNSVNLFGPQPGNVLQFTGSNRQTRVGYSVGGGIEHAFAPGWSAKIEYLYYDLGRTTVAANLIAGSGGVGTGYDVRFRNNGHIVRAGLNYRFGW